jgi:GcrA cell cycle regulator
MRGVRFAWTPELDDKLRRLWADPEVQRIWIPAQLGVSRGCMWTRVDHLGLVRDRASAKRRPRPPGEKQAKPAPAARPAPQPARAPAPPPAPVRYAAGRLCSWPIGEPGTKAFRYCDAPDVVAGKSYCTEHCAIAFTKVREKAALPPAVARIGGSRLGMRW